MDHETASYKYAPLDPSSHVIRLVTILPGQPDDRIDLEITHTILPPADTESVTNKAAIIEIQKTLPPNWYANETLEGRTLFYKENDDGTAMSRSNGWTSSFEGLGELWLGLDRCVVTWTSHSN